MRVTSIARAVTVRQSVRALMAVAMAAAFAVAAAAQEGHPLTGTWYGDYGAGNQKNDLTVIMKWDGRSVSGLINPGPKSVPLKSVVMDITPGKPAPQGQGSTAGTPPVFNVRFEVDGMTFEGTIQNPVAGNRRIAGTWTRGSERGTFQIRRL
jgi:hypothetical protein